MPDERTFKGTALPTDPGCCAGRLLRALAPITSAARVMDALELFTANPELVAIPVVDDGVPTGLINRKQIIEHFARPYTRELFGRKPAAAFMDTQPLVVDVHTDLDDLSLDYEIEEVSSQLRLRSVPPASPRK